MNEGEANSRDTSSSGPSTRARVFHGVIGLLALGVFLATGAYMRYHQPPLAELGEARHASFLSRHIFILSGALVHLVLGAYVCLETVPWRRRLQTVGSGLTTIAALLLIAAFLVEPVAGRGRTPVSSFGLYALLAGSLAHFTARWGR